MGLLYKPAGRAGEYAAGEWALNVADGCMHGCRYCYVPRCLRKTREQFHRQAVVKPDLHARLERDAAAVVRGYTEEERRLHGGPKCFLCFSCDPYGDVEVADATRGAMEILDRHGFEITVLTKGGWNAEADLPWMRDHRVRYGTTLTCRDPADVQRWEPRAAPYRDRIDMLAEAHELGIHTWVSLEPILVPEQTIAIIEETAPVVDEYRVGLLNHVEDIDPELVGMYGLERMEWAHWVGWIRDVLDETGREWHAKSEFAALLPGGRRGNGGLTAG